MFTPFYSRRTQLDSEEIVADLVHCFLIPEVQKTTMREKGIWYCIPNQNSDNKQTHFYTEVSNEIWHEDSYKWHMLLNKIELI